MTSEPRKKTEMSSIKQNYCGKEVDYIETKPWGCGARMRHGQENNKYDQTREKKGAQN